MPEPPRLPDPAAEVVRLIAADAADLPLLIDALLAERVADAFYLYGAIRSRPSCIPRRRPPMRIDWYALAGNVAAVGLLLGWLWGMWICTEHAVWSHQAAHQAMEAFR